MPTSLFQSVENASKLLSKHVRCTPLMHATTLSQRCGNQVYLKAENLQFTGAFKVRGALYKMLSMGKDALEKGVVCASAGNHAQGVAYAASMMGIPATVVMPLRTPAVKVASAKKMGAHVLLFGDNYDEAQKKAKEICEQYHLTEIHPFDDHDVMAGQGTVGAEVMLQMPDCNVILVPVGGGGLLAGVLASVKLNNPKVRVIGVEPLGAAGMFKSLYSGSLQQLEKVATRAEGAAVKNPGAKPFDIIRCLCDEIVVVSEEAIEEAVWQLMRDEKLVVEYAGALAVAALRTLQPLNLKVCCLVTGGNIDGSLISETIKQCHSRSDLQQLMQPHAQPSTDRR